MKRTLTVFQVLVLAGSFWAAATGNAAEKKLTPTKSASRSPASASVFATERLRSPVATPGSWSKSLAPSSVVTSSSTQVGPVRVEKEPLLPTPFTGSLSPLK